jgi:hypothetical protein
MHGHMKLNSFNYLGNFVSHEKEVDVDNNLSNCLIITGIINSMFGPQKTLKKTRIKLYSYTDPSGYAIRWRKLDQ